MKIKKFNNLWAMGLILTGAILVLFYVAKIFFPEFIVGVAEIPRIVQFGNYVNNHKWAFIIFHFIISYLGGYIYGCACCREYKLSIKQNIILIITVAILICIQELFPQMYSPINYVALILMPFLMLSFNKELNNKTFVSSVVCYSVDIISQALSMAIRNIVLLSTCINPATMIILLIDTWIWRILLYLFFNYKK